MSAAEDDHNGFIAQIVAKADGTFELDLIPPEHGPHLLDAALRGSQQAITVLNVIDETIQRIHTDPPLCLCCPATIGRIEGITFGTLRPLVEGAPSTAIIGFAICTKCDVHSASDPRVVQ